MRAAFHDLKEFPALLDLAQAWPKMRQDLDALAAPLMDVDRVSKSHERVAAEVVQRVEAGEPFGWVRGWGRQGGNPNWTQYGLVLDNRANPYASAPRTLALLVPLRGIKVAAFVRLAPGTLLPLHTHPEVAAEGLLQMHVTLKAPKPSASCLLNVAGEIRQHVTGGTLVFDGSLPHWAVNASAEDRVILYLDSTAPPTTGPASPRPQPRRSPEMPEITRLQTRWLATSGTGSHDGNPSDSGSILTCREGPHAEHSISSSLPSLMRSPTVTGLLLSGWGLRRLRALFLSLSCSTSSGSLAIKRAIFSASSSVSRGPRGRQLPGVARRRGPARGHWHRSPDSPQGSARIAMVRGVPLPRNATFSLKYSGQG